MLGGSSRHSTCSPAPPSAAYAGMTPGMLNSPRASDGSTPWERIVTAAAAVRACCSARLACLFGLTLMAMRGRATPRSASGRSKACAAPSHSASIIGGRDCNQLFGGVMNGLGRNLKCALGGVGLWGGADGYVCRPNTLTAFREARARWPARSRPAAFLPCNG